MTIAFARAYSLVLRGTAGLACDDDGVALGPISLVEAATEPSGRRYYCLRPAPEIAEALRLAYGSTAEEIQRYQRGLARVAQLLTAGEGARARIHAVLLAFPEIAPAGMTKLAHAASLQKYNPYWAAESRIPGGPGGGDWTSDGGAGANVRPAAAPMNPVQAMKERFVDAHLDDAQKAADHLGIPVENILALSALESSWGNHPFAVQGNNYFGIHYPAPYATGYAQAKRGPAKVATSRATPTA